AVAEALARAGVKRDQIAFLPGHANEPGGAASPAVRDWWRTACRYATSWADPCWGGQSLPAALASAASELLREPVTGIEDTGEMLSSRLARIPSEHRPPACLTFERPRFRCVTATGRALLWTFAGLASAPGGDA